MRHTYLLRLRTYCRPFIIWGWKYERKSERADEPDQIQKCLRERQNLIESEAYIPCSKGLTTPINKVCSDQSTKDTTQSIASYSNPPVSYGITSWFQKTRKNILTYWDHTEYTMTEYIYQSVLLMLPWKQFARRTRECSLAYKGEESYS